MSAASSGIPGGRGLFTPQSNSTMGRTSKTGTPTDFISPSTKRCSVVLTTPTSAQMKGLTGMNDDEAEKRERRRSKVLELQRRHHDVGSPATPDAPDNRRKSATLSKLSNAQLADHYKDCIKLSTENKINSKNAFGLHLIDYMSDMLKKKEVTNFQVASSTLDASAKIYAGRVDAIHSETYKVLTGLGRGADKPGKGEDGDEAMDVDGEQPIGATAAKRKKRSRRGKIIETNLSKINVKKFDMEFEVDPLFSKTSAAFDEGGTGGLLLNHLRCLDNTSELVLDSATIVTGPENDRRDSMGTTSRLIDIKDLRDRYVGINFDVLQICPEFSTFEFTNWDKDSQDSSLSISRLGNSAHAFDLEAEVEPIPALDEEDEGGGDGGGGFGLDIDDFNPDAVDNNDAVSEAQTDGGKSLQSAVFGDDEESMVVKSAIQSIKQGTIGTLMQVLAAEPSDYSYFNTNLLRTWAGPDHWKLKPKSKDALASKDSGEKTKKKDKKEAFFIKYNDDVNFDAFFKEMRAATTVTKATLDKWSKSSTTLPTDLHYETNKLFRLFTKGTMMIKRQKHSDSENGDLDDGISNYDYDNPNDRENFCPDIEQYNRGGDDEDHHDDSGGDFNFNLTADTVDPSQGGSFISQDGTLLSGENLVQQPRKIAKIDIGYAKTAKKVDAKRLKAHMWDILATPGKEPEKPESEPEKPEQPTETPEEQDENNPDKTQDKSDAHKSRRKSVTGAKSFHEMVQTLPTKMSKTMAENISVPIAFVCLLHLANEKTLQLNGMEDMSDFTISQG